MSNRFLVPHTGMMGSNMEFADTVVVLLDFKWWMAERDTVTKWCSLNLKRWHQEGMIISFDNRKDMTLFLLRWS